MEAIETPGFDTWEFYSHTTCIFHHFLSIQRYLPYKFTYIVMTHSSTLQYSHNSCFPLSYLPHILVEQYSSNAAYTAHTPQYYHIPNNLSHHNTYLHAYSWYKPHLHVRNSTRGAGVSSLGLWQSVNVLWHAFLKTGDHIFTQLFVPHTFARLAHCHSNLVFLLTCAHWAQIFQKKTSHNIVSGCCLQEPAKWLCVVLCAKASALWNVFQTLFAVRAHHVLVLPVMQLFKDAVVSAVISDHWIQK